MVDIPERTESHGPVFIYGVEGEQIEEENDAYNDLRYDIGQCIYIITALWLTMLRTHPREYIERLIPDSTLQFLTEYWIENRCDVKVCI